MFTSSSYIQVPTLEADESKVDSPLPQNMIPERDDLDLTERLWVLLKDNAHCYNDTVLAIKKVLAELQSGQLQPMVRFKAIFKIPTFILRNGGKSMT